MKQVLVYGLLANTEASYGSGGALAAASHGILLAEPAVMSLEYIHDGKRAPSPSTSGMLKKARPSGRSGTLPVKVEGRGRGSAYSASNLPEINALMRASGHSATVDTTLGAEKVTYAPVSDGFTSINCEAYARGELYPLTGVYADFSFEIDGPAFLMFDFELQGLSSALPTDVAVPAITYGTTEPPKAVNVGLSIGAWDPVVRRVSFQKGQARGARADINSGGHKGFAMNRREPSLEITVEAAALATFDPFAARDNATSYAVDLTVGSAQYNRIKFSAAQVQIESVDPSEDEGVSLWTLKCAVNVSGLSANDDYALEFS